MEIAASGRAARLLGLNPRLLATQLTADLWRALGTPVARTVGLGLFVAMQTWGHSMLAPFYPGNRTPDLIVSIAPAGVADPAQALPFRSDEAASEMVVLAMDVRRETVMGSSSSSGSAARVSRYDLDGRPSGP